MAKDLYRYFRIEARELLDELSRGILDLEKAPDDRDLVARLLRHAHTLKGAARVVRQEEMAALAHRAEDLLGPHRDPGSPPVPRDGVDELLRIVDGIADGVRALEPATAPAAPAAPAAASPPRADESLRSVRVDLRDLDALLAAALEAAVRVNGLKRQLVALEHAQEVARILVDRLSARRGDGDAPPPASARIRPLAEELRRAIVDAHRALGARADEADREVTQVRTFADRLRLLPARTLFGALERAARDAARTLGRAVAFEASGGDVRVDANVLAAVREALLHVVRNAVVHGIEPDHERAARGKPPAGRVAVEVERRGRKVAFRCRDDGRGVDAEAVRAAAARKGVRLPEPAGGALDGEALAAVLMRGGISTSETVDALSGRGIGLDVVRDVAARLGAEVSLRSEPGRGTTVEIDVPASLAAMTALHVEAGGTTVALPLDAVRETAFVDASGLADGGSGPTVAYDGKAVPFVPLAAILGRPPSPEPRRCWSAVVVEAGEQLLAVGADRLHGASDIVVRPLPAFVAADPTVAGVTLDVEGEPRLVLDPAGIVARAPAVSAVTAPRPVARAPILVVDDSLTTRMLEQSILESAGYEVEVATSGEEALEKARARPFGLFVVDVEMPGMDGFEFVRITRADPRLSATPAILVTSRSAPEDRERGVAAGASAYIVKSEFDQNRLLAEIEGLLR